MGIAAACLIGLAWFDAVLLDDARKTAAATFDGRGYLVLAGLGFVLVAGAILLVAAAGWWSRSVLAGAVYVVTGAFLVLMPALAVDATLNGPLGSLISNALFTSTGPIFAVEMLGGCLLLSGLVVIARSVLNRTRTSEPTVPTDRGGV